MGRIFCLMGKSSSGKDTIFNSIKNIFQDELLPVVTYTTRPMRNGEDEGKEYHFITEKELNEFAKCNKVVEQRVYNTVNGLWYYATIDDGSINEDNNYIMIVTLEAYNNLIKYYGKEKIVPIYIYVEDGVRLERAIIREKQQESPNYNELCRRFIADNKDFSEDNLKKSGINYLFNNNNLEECIKEISKTINKYLTEL